MRDKIYASLGGSSEIILNFRILSKAVSGEEKRQDEGVICQKKSNSLAILPQNQFGKLERLKEDTDLKKMGYRSGSCPKAEKLAKGIISLPTRINVSEKQAQKIVDFLNTIYSTISTAVKNVV